MSDPVSDPAPNPPGQSVVAYRSGTHGEVLARMLAELSHELPDLTVRTTEDPSISLLDAWATVADIMTFYTQQIANEGFLRTATERLSVLELARAIGYELHPGVAASTYLAFTIETAPGSPSSTVIPMGTKVRSIPAQDQLPQTFETSAEVVAEQVRNELRLVRRQPQAIGIGTDYLYLAGVDTGLQPGDAILIVGEERAAFGGSEQWDFRVLRTVEPLPGATPDEPSRTLIRWDVGLGLDDRPTPRAVEPAVRNIEVHAFRLRAGLFGHNAPAWRTMPAEVRRRYAGENHESVNQWPGFALPGSGEDPLIDLDASYPAVQTGSWLVLRRPGYEELYRVESATQSAREDYGISSKTTRVLLDAEEHLSWFGIRPTAVHTQSELLPLADEPVTTPVTGPVVFLESEAPLVEDMPLIITGTSIDDPTREVTELVRIAHVDETHLTLEQPLSEALDPQTVRIFANVVAATHGETVEQALGSGDGSASHQRFRLQKKDLTHLSATTPRGVQDTLVVRVDDVEWTETTSLYLAGARESAYVVRLSDSGDATVVFGDGVRGARLPTGQENIRATYRSGIGPDGNVAAGTLSLLAQRPLGVREVVNPVPATGGTARERLDDARVNAPLTVLTMDRVVSLRDHEDFARAFGGIAKARAVRLWDGASFLVHVTVAAPAGAAISADTMALLRGSFEEFRDPSYELRIDAYQPLSFAVELRVLPDPAYEKDVVLADVSTALAEAYSFDQRNFVQAVSGAEVTTIVQGVRGVVASNLTALHLTGEGVALRDIVIAHDAYMRRGEVVPAELLLIDPTAITVTEMTT